MANRKISELGLITSFDNTANDCVHVYVPGNAAAADKNKRMVIDQLFANAPAITSSGAITDGAASSFTTGTTIGTLTLADGSITDSSGAISFGNENLSTTGTLASGALTVTGAASPNADDGGALGASGTGWSDLFLASGAVVNFNAGDVTITHSANKLTMAGGNLDLEAVSFDAGSNYLDTYEEGAFTPTIGGTSTYNTQEGQYTLIGNRCYFNLYISVNNPGTGSQNIVSGLPFTSSAKNQAVTVGFYTGLGTSIVDIRAYVTPSGTAIQTANSTAAATGVAAGNLLATGGAQIIISGHYEIA